MKNFLRGIKFALISFRRDPVVSLGTTFVMVLTLFVISTVTLIGFISEFVAEELQGKIEVTVYFDRNASRAEIEEVMSYIEALPEVKDLAYVSEEEVLEKFQTENAEDTTLMAGLQAVGDQNPFNSYVAVHAFSSDQYPAISDAVDIDEYDTIISSVDYHDSKFAIEQLTRITKTLKESALALSGLFALVAILVIFNTIRLAIYSYREEIEIMKLVGASNWFVRWPFIVEGIVYGLIAALVTTALLYPVMSYVSPKLGALFESDQLNLLLYYQLNWYYILGVLAASGGLLGILSSIFAIGKYLRK